MVDGDARPEPSVLFPNQRQLWDGDHYLGKAIAASLGAPSWTAWDVYLFYPPGAHVGDKPAAMLAQIAGVVVATPGVLPKTDELPAKLRGRDLVVVGDQDHLSELLGKVVARFAR